MDWTRSAFRLHLHGCIRGAQHSTVARHRFLVCHRKVPRSYHHLHSLTLESRRGLGLPLGRLPMLRRAGVARTQQTTFQARHDSHRPIIHLQWFPKRRRKMVLLKSRNRRRRKSPAGRHSEAFSEDLRNGIQQSRPTKSKPLLIKKQLVFHTIHPSAIRQQAQMHHFHVCKHPVPHRTNGRLYERLRSFDLIPGSTIDRRHRGPLSCLQAKSGCRDRHASVGAPRPLHLRLGCGNARILLGACRRTYLRFKTNDMTRQCQTGSLMITCFQPRELPGWTLTYRSRNFPGIVSCLKSFCRVNRNQVCWRGGRVKFPGPRARDGRIAMGTGCTSRRMALV